MKPFHDSMIWQLNRNYYNDIGIDAWSSGEVPHNITSNSYVGKTYAALIFSLLNDLARKDQFDKVYIVELGAGHARLCFHVLIHLDKMIAQSATTLPAYCFVLSDIAEKNLSFFASHEQLLPYFIEGKCDYAFYDAMEVANLELQYSKKVISSNSLDQIIIVIGNYFFDSIPQDLYHIQKNTIAECYVELSTKSHDANNEISMEDIEFSYEENKVITPYDEKYLNEILASYKSTIENSHILFPNEGLKCIEGLKQLSNKGMVLLSMDKGAHLLADIDNKPLPDFVTHGSFSFQVNFHAFQEYCNYFDGKSCFPEGSNFHVELACLLCMPNPNTYTDTIASYEKNVNEFGPDDYYGMTKNHYTTIDKMSIKELLYLIRFSAFDSTFFINIMPSFKKAVENISKKERPRIRENLHSIWQHYFNINEPQDLAFEMGAMFFNLGYYDDALMYFDHSVHSNGSSEDVSYNRALCLYQLNRDEELKILIKLTNKTYPGFDKINELVKLIN